jgi:hypothetical protein
MADSFPLSAGGRRERRESDLRDRLTEAVRAKLGNQLGDATQAELALRLALDVYSDFRRAIARELAREKRRRGLPPCQHPGPGFRFAGRRPRRRLVPDPAQREVMARMVAWREAGETFEGIARRLQQDPAAARLGGWWYAKRCARAYRAEIRIRAEAVDL